jgi:hypothetical protein
VPFFEQPNIMIPIAIPKTFSLVSPVSTFSFRRGQG